MSPELILGPRPHGIPLSLYLALLDSQEREAKALKKVQAKRGKR